MRRLRQWRYRLRLRFIPKDFWIGVYVDRRYNIGFGVDPMFYFWQDKLLYDKQLCSVDIYVCLVPTLPLHIEVRRPATF